MDVVCWFARNCVRDDENLLLFTPAKHPLNTPLITQTFVVTRDMGTMEALLNSQKLALLRQRTIHSPKLGHNIYVELCVNAISAASVRKA